MALCAAEPFGSDDARVGGMAVHARLARHEPWTSSTVRLRLTNTSHSNTRDFHRFTTCLR
jgi:hypothetical protein